MVGLKFNRPATSLPSPPAPRPARLLRDRLLRGDAGDSLVVFVSDEEEFSTREVSSKPVGLRETKPLGNVFVGLGYAHG